MKITENHFNERKKVTNTVKKHNFEENITIRRRGKELTEERKREHSEYIKQVQKEIKNKTRT